MIEPIEGIKRQQLARLQQKGRHDQIGGPACEPQPVPSEVAQPALSECHVAGDDRDGSGCLNSSSGFSASNNNNGISASNNNNDDNGDERDNYISNKMDNAISNDGSDGKGSVQSGGSSNRPQSCSCIVANRAECVAPLGIVASSNKRVQREIEVDCRSKKCDDNGYNGSGKPMRSSCFESPSPTAASAAALRVAPLELEQQPLVEQQRLRQQSDEWIQAGGSCGPPLSGCSNWRECSTNYSNCYLIESAAAAEAEAAKGWPPVKGDTTGQSQQRQQQESQQQLPIQQQRELEVEWTEPSLFRRAARFSGGTGDNSRSLCIRTSLVESLKGKGRVKVLAGGDTIGRAIKSFVGDFRSSFNDNPKQRSQYQQQQVGVGFGTKTSGSKRGSASSEDSCANIATSETEPLNKSSSYRKAKGCLRASVSCQSALDQQQQQQPRQQQHHHNHQYRQQQHSEAELEAKSVPMTTTNKRVESEAGEELNPDRTIIAIGQSSSNNKRLLLSKELASNMASGGCVAKNKYIIEDKLRRQQQQPPSRCDRLEDRRPTYCSSVGATDVNYDSSFSSANNCSESNNTCAMIRQCSREFTSRQEAGNHNDCKRPSSNQSITPSGGSNSNNNNNKKQRNQEGLKKRENWDKNIEFLLAVIGFAVDLGNVWRFPYICYKNGGGAFLIPYTIMFILGGLPIFYLEMSLGQYFSSGCLTVWKWVCPMAKGIGYAMCVLNFFTGLYYNTIISWAVFFFVESFTSVLPWTSCNNLWNSNDCKTIDQRQALKFNTSYTLLAQSESSQAQPVHFSSPTKDYFEREVLQVHLSSGIDDLGYIRKPLAIYLAIVFICIYFAIWKGVKSTGKAVWITALLPYFVLIPLLIRGVFLEGAWLGIKYYLYPQWLKIIDVDVWVEAAKQIYFSLGPGFGTLMALSSYNKFNHNCRRDALIAATVNYFASFISGLVIFAVLGYMATIENVSISDVATEGPGLVFQVYPEGLATMRFSSMWSILFFIMVITLGIDSTFGGLESVITGLCDEYPRVLRAHRGIFIAFLIILIYLCSLPTTTYGGNYVIYVLESYGTSLSLLFIVLIETIIVCWLYGADKFCRNLEEMYGEMPGAYWRVCWKYISPTILLIIFCAACGQELNKYHTLKNGDYTYPGWAPTVGLLMTGSSVCCIPIYAIYHIKTKTSGTFLERLKIASRPIEGDQKVEKDIYVDALTDKIGDEDDPHPDTII